MNADPKIVDPRLSRVGKRIPRVGRYLLLGAAVAILASVIIKGCEYFPESTFQLASESRLPKWITLPPGLTRADVSITMSYYSEPWGRRSVFILQDSKGKTLEKAYGKEKCWKPFELKNPPQGFPPGYPAYEEITVNGTTELIEHRKMEPVFYIADDPAVWSEYRAVGCG
jgi:hypothetical protein